MCQLVCVSVCHSGCLKIVTEELLPNQNRVRHVRYLLMTPKVTKVAYLGITQQIFLVGVGDRCYYMERGLLCRQIAH